MALSFEWQDERDELLGEFKACFIELPGGKIIQGLRARIQESENSVEWDDDDMANTRHIVISKAFYPALDALILGGWVRLVGGFQKEPRPGRVPGMAKLWKVVEDPAAEQNPELPPETRLLEDLCDVSIRMDKRYRSVSDESFDDAVSTVGRFVRECVADLRDDAQNADGAWGGEVITVTQVAELFGVPRNTVLNWISTGSLRAFRFGHKWMIRRQDLAAAMKVSSKQADKA